MESPHQDFSRTRSSLIRRVHDLEDDASWREFYDIYHNLIYGVARKTGLTDAEAKDVVQETMASVAKKMPEFEYKREGGSFKAWLLRLTRWRIVDQLRKRLPPAVQHPSADGTGTGPINGLEDPVSNVLDEVWESEWRDKLLEAANTCVKRQLDPERYQIYDFYVNKRMPAAMVAERFQIPVEQVYLAKHRIVELIKAEVARLEKKMV